MRGLLFALHSLPLYIQFIIQVQRHRSRISKYYKLPIFCYCFSKFDRHSWHPLYIHTENRAVSGIQNNTEMAIARLLLTISALISVISLQVVYGGIVCEKLPVEVCAFSVSSSGARCVLEKSILTGCNVQYECQTTEVIAENMNELIETDECITACGVERMTVGMSTDSLAEHVFTKKLCSPLCYNNCPNIIDLYFNLAAGEGVYLPRLCESHRSRDRRMMEYEVVLSAVAPAPVSA